MLQLKLVLIDEHMITINILVISSSPNWNNHSSLQCAWKTFMIHQTFVPWALCILFKFVKSLITYLGLAIGNVWCVQWFSWTLPLWTDLNIFRWAWCRAKKHCILLLVMDHVCSYIKNILIVVNKILYTCIHFYWKCCPVTNCDLFL